jgi:hypothetical protein
MQQSRDGSGETQMAYFNFTFENTQNDQTFVVEDQKDTSKNPIFAGPVNHGDFSPPIACWTSADGKGRVAIQGSSGVKKLYDIRSDGDSVRY